MVNFSERLESQLVPEWRDAYCDYSQLKRDLEHIKRHSGKYGLGSPRIQSPSLKVPSFQQLGSIARRMSSRIRDAAVKVHVKKPDNGSNHEEYFETELMIPFGEVEADKIFFARLDGQLNKVNGFYRKKEKEFLDKGEEIKEQLEKMSALQKMLKEQQDHSVRDGEDDSPSGNGSEGSPLGGDMMGENEVVVDIELASITEDASVGKVLKNTASPAQVFGLNVPQDTPSLAIATVTQKIVDDFINQRNLGKSAASPYNSFTRLDKKNLQYARKMLREACIELYRGLGLLRGFSSLNFTAFSKIMKKYDKSAGRDALIAYMKAVERAYFHHSDKVARLMDALERRFVEHFTDGNHKKAMLLLRPMRQTASHKVTFFLGFFTGCSLACLVAFFILLDFKWFDSTYEGLEEDKTLYLTAMFPLFSILILVLIHLIMLGWNLYAWREKKINYAFIFGFSPNVDIKYREVFLVASCLTALVTGTLLGHFMVYTNLTSSFLTVIMPLSVLLAFMLLLFCPLNICYRPTRFFFLTCIRHIVLAPFYKVVMSDFYVADQLTSQVFMFRSAEYVLCYSIIGQFKEENIGVCSGNSVHYQVVAYLVSLLPYWWRFLQCVRRWIDERDSAHITNGVKYMSALFAAAISLTYHYNKTVGWMSVFIIVSTLVAGFQLYWDVCIDWGLLRTDSKNYLLRDQLLLDNKNIYFASIALNFVLRFAWLQSVTQIQFFGLDRRFSDLFFASLEVVRRGHWNFYRLENEHLNNVGKFRATKAIPLPFASAEDE